MIAFKPNKNALAGDEITLQAWLVKCATAWGVTVAGAWDYLKRGRIAYPKGCRRPYVRRVYVPANTPVPELPNRPRANEVPLKAWVASQSVRRGIPLGTAWELYYRGRLGRPTLRRVNQRVVFVQLS